MVTFFVSDVTYAFSEFLHHLLRVGKGSNMNLKAKLKTKHSDLIYFLQCMLRPGPVIHIVALNQLCLLKCCCFYRSLPYFFDSRCGTGMESEVLREEVEVTGMLLHYFQPVFCMYLILLDEGTED